MPDDKPTLEFRYGVLGRRGQAHTQKLRDEQIANQSTWGRVPETDMIKAASHSIRVVPVGSTTITIMNEMDPGISEESVGEGRGWTDVPKGYGPIVIHGRGMR